MSDGVVMIGIVCVFVVIIAVMLTLLTPWYRTLEPDDYGNYLREEGECTHNMKTVDYVCQPHPVTNRGCDLSTLPGNDGRSGISYETVRYEHQPCKVNQIKTEWSDPIFGECVDGAQSVTQTCVYTKEGFVNKEGVNNCFVTTGNNGVEYYLPGDVVNYSQLCAIPSPIHGEWILLNPIEAQNLPRNVNIPISLPFRTLLSPPINRYINSDHCLADGVLEEGVMLSTVACKSGDNMVIPTTSTTSCIGEVPNFARMLPCRYLPNYSRFYHLAAPNGLTIREIQLTGVQQKTIGLPIVRADMALSIGPGNPARFLFVHEEEGRARVAIVMNGLAGFLNVNRANQLVLQQGKMGPDTPGITVSEARVFSIDMIPSESGVRIRFSKRYSIIDERGEMMLIRNFMGTSFSVF